MSSYELWKSRASYIDFLKCGCVMYYKNTGLKRTELGPRGIKCAFICDVSNSKAYRLLNLESNVIIEFRDVKLFENLITKDRNKVLHK